MTPSVVVAIIGVCATVLLTLLGWIAKGVYTISGKLTENSVLLAEICKRTDGLSDTVQHDLYPKLNDVRTRVDRIEVAHEMNHGRHVRQEEARNSA